MQFVFRNGEHIAVDIAKALSYTLMAIKYLKGTT
jgi:hypothetical protein